MTTTWICKACKQSIVIEEITESINPEGTSVWYHSVKSAIRGGGVRFCGPVEKHESE